MILTGIEILNEVNSGNIVISPFSEKHLNPNSYNYRIGDKYIELNGELIYDTKSPVQSTEKTIPKEGLLLKPDKLYLCSTHETIGSKNYVTSLIGKSSMGRLGLFLQVSANLGHQGEIHKWTLELKCVKPIVIYPLIIIGQITFWKTKGVSKETNGYYALHDKPTNSIGI